MEWPGVRTASIVPYYSAGGGRLHGSLHGVRVRFEGREEPVDYPTTKWDAAVTVGDTVDAVVRRSFFGDEYDGLGIAKRLREDQKAEGP